MFPIFRLLFKGFLMIIGGIFFSRCNQGYKEKNGKIYYKGKEARGENLVIINDVFARDNNGGYYRDVLLEGSSGASFTALDRNYAKDNSRVFFCREYRNGQTYYTTKTKNIQVIAGADAASFQLAGAGYAKDKNRVFLYGLPFAVDDVASFEGIDEQFSKDRRTVYFRQKSVKDSDPKTFRILDRHYASDVNTIYYFGYPSEVKDNIYPISGRVPGFKIMEYPYSSDGASMFYENLVIEKADAVSFAIMGRDFAKDAQSVFYRSSPLPGADHKTFSPILTETSDSIGNYYAKDISHVYFGNKIVQGAEPGSFRLLNTAYAVDGKRVYYQHLPVRGADLATFEVYPHGFGDADAKDKKTGYFEGKAVKL